MSRIRDVGMEIDKTMKKETAWKIKLDEEGKMLIVNAIEDTAQGDSNATISMVDGENKVSISLSKDKFLNLIGVLDSFSQICLGVEPKLPEEDYAPRPEPVAPTKKPELPIAPKASQAVKAEPKKVEPVAKAKVEPVQKAREEPAPKAKPAAPVKKPANVPASTLPVKVDIKKPVPAKPAATTSSTPSKPITVSVQKPKQIAFPPKFPEKPVEKEEDEEEFVEEKEEEPEEYPKAAPLKPTPPKIPQAKAVKTGEEGRKEKEIDEEGEAPEWDPW